MIKITQTDYIDFLSRSGTSKSSKVREIFNRSEYHPSNDFYKSIREEIVDHLKNQRSKSEIYDFLDRMKHSRKLSRFLSLVNGYLKFIGRKKIQWIDPPNECWNYKDLRVKINPEIGLSLAGEKYLIKLYFKETPLEKKDVKVLLWMMEETLCQGIFKGYKCALLDVERSKLRYFKKSESPLSALIEGEAECFLKLWQSFERKSA